MTTNFQNTLWSLPTNSSNQYTFGFASVGVDITLYWSDYFDNYVSWLDNTASNYVTTEDPLTANDLTSFQTKIDNYDGWTI